MAIEEQTGQVQTTLSAILARFDGQAERLEQLSAEMKNLGQQVGMQQDSLDEVKRTQMEFLRRSSSPIPPPPPPPPRQQQVPPALKLPYEAGQVSTVVPPGMLTNHGPPLLSQPHSGAATYGVVTAPVLPAESSGFVKPPKLDFPKFFGENPRLWLDRCQTYFEMYHVPGSQWVATATMYVEGHAALWLQAYKRQHVLLGWDVFAQAIEEEFGADAYEAQMNKLLQLKQTGTVAEYRLAFEASMYYLLSLDATLNPKFFVTQFILGLKDEVRGAVRLQSPNSVTRAVILARIQEEELEAVRPRHRVTTLPKTTNTLPATVQNPASAAVKGEHRKVGEEYWRERQLRDYRRANGLCFKCGDKYSREHTCKKPVQLLTIEVGDFGEVLPDDTLQAINLTENPSGDECFKLSLHAVSGMEELETVRLRALVGNQVMLILVDSGSTHSFVNRQFLHRTQLTAQPIASVTVKVANGEKLQCDSMIPSLQWWIQGITFATDMRVLDLGAYDAVLGMDWLQRFSPMNCHWGHKTLTFAYAGQQVCIQGVTTKQQESLSELSSEQFQKWYNGNDIWSIAVLEQQPFTSPEQHTEIPTEVQSLLQNYMDIFQEPKSLPPHRQYDHAITLEHGTTPVNVRPYRYSPLQKDEIERQVAEMLGSGMITPSMSPYASPVLLVQKKDSSWRFCVDYQRLNKYTVKNKFPLPIVDELLDELAGTQFFSKLDLRVGYHQI